METDERIERLLAGNRRYRESSDAALREQTAVHGQHPRAIVIACSDARVIPEEIFDAVLGELFVIRVAGNVLDNHQLGSIEYAAAHLGWRRCTARATASSAISPTRSPPPSAKSATRCARAKKTSCTRSGASGMSLPGIWRSKTSRCAARCTTCWTAR